MMPGRANRSRAFLLIIRLSLRSIDPHSDSSGSNTLHPFDRKSTFSKRAAALLLALVTLVACENRQAEATASTCGDKGLLQAMLSGAIGAKLDWPDEALRCESMPRPDDEGVRLLFSGEVGDKRLAVIIALPGLDPGETGGDFDSNVTLSVEGSGRFFSTPNPDTCWTNIAVNEPLEDGSTTYNVLGGLSCVAPLGEINGDGFVDIQLLRFSGIANWGSQ